MLFAAVVGVWVRSFWVSDWVGRVYYTPGIVTEDHHVYLRTVRGKAVLVGGGDPPGNFSHVRWAWRRSEPWNYPAGPDGPPLLRALGIGWENEHRVLTGETTCGVQVHLAWPASLLGLTTCFLALRRRRPRRGLCATCGYDLRATPGRCPECGTPAA